MGKQTSRNIAVSIGWVVGTKVVLTDTVPSWVSTSVAMGTFSPCYWTIPIDAFPSLASSMVWTFTLEAWRSIIVVPIVVGSGVIPWSSI